MIFKGKTTLLKNKKAIKPILVRGNFREENKTGRD